MVGPSEPPCGGRLQTTTCCGSGDVTVVSDCGKGVREASGGDQEDGAQSPYGDRCGRVVIDQMASKPGVTFWPGISLADIRLLARWCPAWRRRESDLPLPCGTWGKRRDKPA